MDGVGRSAYGQQMTYAPLVFGVLSLIAYGLAVIEAIRHGGPVEDYSQSSAPIE
jgi:hypothetical protein